MQNNYYQNIVKLFKAGFKVCFIITGVFIFQSCTSSVRFSTVQNENKGKLSVQNGVPVAVGTILYGKASYYGDEFDGRKTANGEYYDRNKISAAHKTLPFGTLLKIKNLKNNREVVVTINDRGPYSAGRVIDLSYAAAREIDMLRDGVVDVEITVLE